MLIIVVIPRCDNNSLTKVFLSRSPFDILSPALSELKPGSPGKQMNPSPYPAPFNSAHGQARLVKILLINGAVVTLMSLLSENLSLAFSPFGEEQALEDNPMGFVVLLLTFLLAVLELIVYLTTVVFFCVWLYRAAENLRRFNQWSRLSYSSGFAVGSFFIPFANLVIPYRAVKEVWQQSLTEDEGLISAPGAPAIFPVWWTFWLASSFAGNISMRLSFTEGVPHTTATLVSIIASALHIIAAVFAYQVVDAIDKRQEETSGKLNLGRFSGPPPPPADLSNYVAPTPNS